MKGIVRTEHWGPEPWIILIQDDPHREMVMPRTELLRAAAAHLDRDGLARVLYAADPMHEEWEDGQWVPVPYDDARVRAVNIVAARQRQADAVLAYLGRTP